MVGQSSKGIGGSGYIGQKGIGFKSVFRVSSRPEIHSKGFAFSLDEHMVVPMRIKQPSTTFSKWLKLANAAAATGRNQGVDDITMTYGRPKSQQGTTIVLPLTEEFSGVKEPKKRAALAQVTLPPLYLPLSLTLYLIHSRSLPLTLTL